MRRLGFAAVALLALGAAQPSLAFEPQVLQAELSRYAGALPGGVGVAAIHVESGKSVMLGAGQPYPLASVVKLPIAVYILEQIDQGKLTLESAVEVTRADFVPGGPLARQIGPQGATLSVAALLRLMMTRSDNTATDVLLRLAGGPQAVQGWLRDKRFGDFRVDRTIREMLADYYQLRGKVTQDVSMVQTMDELSPDETDRLDRESGLPKPLFDADPRDQASPLTVARFLAAAARGDLLSKDGTATLLEIMRACETGSRRIRGLLPPWAPVGNKTGTLGGNTNDVAVIDLPEGRGELIIAAFVTRSRAPVAQREKTIADISRTIYDAFVVSLPSDPRAPASPIAQGRRPGSR